MSSAAEFLPESRSLRALERAAAGCRGCELYKDATQTVFGAGRAGARLMLVGEQPGDKEDREGEPFVGPAGRLLDKALQEAGIDRSQAYVTNAVKHFKWRPRGKRRLHQTPRVGEIEACRPWLRAEVEAVRPEAVLAMGATAARALFGPEVKVTKDRGRPLESPLGGIGETRVCGLARAGPSGARTQGGRIAALFGRPRTPQREVSAAARGVRGFRQSLLAPLAAVTIHPSAILRLRDHDEREAEFAAFVADLEGVAAAPRAAG